MMIMMMMMIIAAIISTVEYLTENGEHVAVNQINRLYSLKTNVIIMNLIRKNIRRNTILMCFMPVVPIIMLCT